MDITKLTLAEFLCDGNAAIVPANEDEFEKVAAGLVIGAHLRDLGQGYALHQCDEQAGDVVLLHDGAPVGCYWGELLTISEAHQDRKLSVPLILQAVAERGAPAERTMSVAGKGALILAWKVANAQVANPWP